MPATSSSGFIRLYSLGLGDGALPFLILAAELGGFVCLCSLGFGRHQSFIPQLTGQDTQGGGQGSAVFFGLI